MLADDWKKEREINQFEYYNVVPLWFTFSISVFSLWFFAATFLWTKLVSLSIDNSYSFQIQMVFVQRSDTVYESTFNTFNEAKTNRDQRVSGFYNSLQSLHPIPSHPMPRVLCKYILARYWSSFALSLTLKMIQTIGNLKISQAFSERELIFQRQKQLNTHTHKHTRKLVHFSWFNIAIELIWRGFFILLQKKTFFVIWNLLIRWIIKGGTNCFTQKH